MSGLRIALDYDGTFTEDPVLWFRFVQMAAVMGHQVFIVTMRHEHEGERIFQEVYPLVAGTGLAGVIFTGREAKKTNLERRGILPMDIWIDDNPHWVNMDAADRVT